MKTHTISGNQKNNVARVTDRCHPSSSGDVSKFTIPTLSFEATDYYELIKWLDFPGLEPLITCKFTENDLEEAIKTVSMSDLEKYPCHTQAVEKHVKVVTDAARPVCGKEH